MSVNTGDLGEAPFFFRFFGKGVDYSLSLAQLGQGLGAWATAGGNTNRDVEAWYMAPDGLLSICMGASSKSRPTTAAVLCFSHQSIDNRQSSDQSIKKGVSKKYNLPGSLYPEDILRTSDVSSTNLGSIVIFSSCVVGTYWYFVCRVLLLFVAVCLVRAGCPVWRTEWSTRTYRVSFHTSTCVPVGEKTSAVLLCFAVRDIAPTMSHCFCDVVAHQLPQPRPAHCRALQ